MQHSYHGRELASTREWWRALTGNSTEIPRFCSAEFSNVTERITNVEAATQLYNEAQDSAECWVDYTDYSSYPTPPLDPCEAAGVIVYCIILLYTFAGLAIVCDEFFVPALEVMVERFNLSNDVAGATLMAAGGSAPELFTSVMGTFLSKSNVGFGTIVGSAVFNVLFVIGMCAMFSKEVLSLTWWPLFRDSSFYAISLGTLALLYSNGSSGSQSQIDLWEAGVLLGMYAMYVTIMKFNHELQALAESCLDRSLRKFTRKTGVTQVAPDGDTVDKLEPRLSSGHNHGPNDAYHARRYSNPFMFHNQFRSGLLHLMYKEGNVLDHARFHIVAGIKGDVKQTFQRLDIDMNGRIDVEEIRHVLQDLTGKAPSKEETLKVFEDLEVNPDEGMDLATFTKWYIQSEHRVLAEAERCFKIMDTSGDNHLDRNEIAAVIQSMKRERNFANAMSEEEVDKALQEFDVDSNGKISLEEFLKWYQKSMLWQEVLTEVAEEEDGGPLELEWPETWRGRLFFILTSPIVIPLWCTIPDVRREGRDKLYPITWCLSITWIAGYSYVMVFVATLLGDALGVAPSVMGVTFLAAGTSIPDLITSVIVARQGFGDMAVSSSIGSNIFDILIGLPVPWFLYNLVYGEAVEVVGEGLFWSVIILILMLASVIFTIAINHWRMTKSLGASMFLLYVVFLAQDLYRQSLGCTV